MVSVCGQVSKIKYNIIYFICSMNGGEEKRMKFIGRKARWKETTKKKKT
jgi:hypothetical protein